MLRDRKTLLGSVIEFRLPKYFVYGAITEENKSRGDTLLMFSRKYSERITSVDDLYGADVRCKFLFLAKLAASKKNSDTIRIVGKLDVGKLPSTDRRFRVCLAGISDNSKWQIIDGDARFVAPFLTTDTALLSDGDMPNLDYIREYYDADYYPWSAALTSRGSTNFDPEKFEAAMRHRNGTNTRTVIH